MLVLGALAITAPKRRRARHGRAGNAYFPILFLTVGTALAIGAREPEVSPFEIAILPTIIPGIFGFAAVKLRPRNGWLGTPWLAWHIGGLGGSYIGAVTATLFQLVPRVAPEGAVVTGLIWATPTVVGTALIMRAIAKRLGPLPRTA